MPLDIWYRNPVALDALPCWVLEPQTTPHVAKQWKTPEPLCIYIVLYCITLSTSRFPAKLGDGWKSELIVHSAYLCPFRLSAPLLPPPQDEAVVIFQMLSVHSEDSRRYVHVT